MYSNHPIPEFEYTRSPDQDAASISHHSVVVVGAGPVGLAAGIDLAQYGIDAVVIDDNNTVSTGSRAVCYAKRSLDICDRLGVAERCIDKGITWNLGRVFFQDNEIYNFNVLPEQGHRRPGFINLQQYYLESFLVDRLESLTSVDLRWKNKLLIVKQNDKQVIITIDTPDGQYQISCDYLIACDGANSSARRQCGLESKGQDFQDSFLIADVVMDQKNFPTERWFWFDPPFHSGQSTLLHRQPDNVWRIDFDLGSDADREEEIKPENIIPRVKAFLGEDVEFELEWASIYTFTCRRMDNFQHGRVFFAGDAAHQVSPFGARGANSGIEDVDNLVWKIKAVLDGQARQELLTSYSSERIVAADENILNSTRSTDFISPKNQISQVFRDTVLTLAKDYAFARLMVNSGRLSVPAILTDSPLNQADLGEFESSATAGAPCTDGPIEIADKMTYLLSCLGNRFCGLLFINQLSDLDKLILDDLEQLTLQPTPIRTLIICNQDLKLNLPEGLEGVIDSNGTISRRLDADAGSYYLIRPDQLICARMRKFGKAAVISALHTALANSTNSSRPPL